MEKIINIIADELKVRASQVDATIKLIDEGNTIPFIARYRKEVTGGLSDEQLRILGERLNYLRNLENRKEEVKNSIEEQGKLTDEIVKALGEAKILAEVEDIYRPYKQKKRTRATIAKEKGLEPLAQVIIEQNENEDIYDIATRYIDIDKEINTAEEAIKGAMDIIAENISDNPNYRKEIKRICYRDGLIVTKAAKNEKSSYEMYYDFSEKVNRIPSHRILAINRGEKEEFLKVKIEKPEDVILNFIQKDIIKDINKEDIINILSNLSIKFYIIMSVIVLIWIFILMTISTITDVLVIATMGYIISKIINKQFTFTNIFNIAIHAITLSVLLGGIYYIINSLTGFYMKYFSIMYTSIAIIYIMTSILLITSDNNENNNIQDD